MERKRIFKLSRAQWVSVAVLASSVGLAAAVSVPNSFTAGTTISASQMNANFSALGTAVTAAESSLATAQTNISSLQTGLATAQTNITALQADVTGLQNSSLSASAAVTGPTATLTTTAVELVGIQFTCPANGFVLAQGHVVVNVNHTNLTGDNVFVKVSTTIETAPGGVGWTQAVVPPELPNLTAFRIPTSVTSRIACTGGVNTRYRLNLSSANGTGSSGLFGVLVLNYSKS